MCLSLRQSHFLTGQIADCHPGIKLVTIFTQLADDTAYYERLRNATNQSFLDEGFKLVDSFSGGCGACRIALFNPPDSPEGKLLAGSFARLEYEKRYTLLNTHRGYFVFSEQILNTSSACSNSIYNS